MLVRMCSDWNSKNNVQGKDTLKKGLAISQKTKYRSTL